MKYFKNFSVVVALLFFGLTLAPALAGADVAPTNPGANFAPANPGANAAPANSGNNSLFQLQNPLGNGTNSFCQLIKTLLNVIILLGIPVATFFVVYAGFKLVLARGRPGELEKAKMNLYWTIIGIAIFLGAWLLAQVISNTITLLDPTFAGICK